MTAAQPEIDDVQLPIAEIVPQTPTHDQIEFRAYQLWQTRMRHGIEGTADQDWLTAEKEFSSAREEREASDGRLHGARGTVGD